MDQTALDETRRYLTESLGMLRPRLHRFCARMCGSALDGEDLVQETLAQAFERLSSLEDPTRLEAWLFRIAHHRCVDFLRRERRTREGTVPYDGTHDTAPARDGDMHDDAPIDDALVALVGQLPPKERASVLLKDVLDYSLAEVAEIVDSTIGGVKAALHRGRAKLHALRTLVPSPVRAALDAERRRLLEAYADCFNRRDWDALRRLIEADARLEIVGAAEGTLGTTGLVYTRNYSALPWEWQLAPALVDGEPLLVLWRRDDGTTWYPHAAVRLWWHDGRVARIRDYVHVDYLLQDARIESLGHIDA